jgi:hypothetical protein
MGYMVFLSHNAVDAPWVKWIGTNCNAIGIEAYLYEHDLRPGQMLADKVQAAIRNSDALVVLLTENSVFSPYVQQEVGLAKGLHKSVIPLVQPGIGQQHLAMLQGVEYIEFDFGNPAPGLAHLLEYLQKAKLNKERNQALLALGSLVAAALVLGR